MTTFRLTLEYDGTDFDGWQVQKVGRTVQGTLETALTRVTGEDAAAAGSGRTDAGVHAAGQVASVRLDTSLDASGLARALNGVLPNDLAVVAAAAAPDDFHARKHARSKLYVYRLWTGGTPSPLRRRFCHWLATPLDVGAMCAAAGHCVGEHDFASFQGAGSDVERTVRTLFRLDVEGDSPGEVRFEAEGSGFLRHMVRNLVGTLIEVGRGRRAADSLPELLAARDRRLAGPTAAARGLTLARVDY